jgi:hypothetical protein
MMEFLMAIKIRSTPFFGEEVKPSVPCRKILWHVQEPYRYEKRHFVGKINGHFSPSFSCFAIRYLCWLLPKRSGGCIKIDYSSDEDAQQIRNGRKTWDALCDTTP